MKVILNARKLEWVIERLVHSLLEDLALFPNTVLIGIQPRGVYFAKRIHNSLVNKGIKNIPYGAIDTTFYRDDVANSDEIRIPDISSLPFDVDGKRVILVDDVLYTGRTIRSAIDAIIDYGRPDKIELMVLIDRRLSRHLPIQPDYVGLSIDSIEGQKVNVLWKEKDQKDEVILIDK